MLTVAIQAGGESRRMGQDKALLPFCNQPLIQRVVQRIQPIADEILVTTNQPEAYGFLGLPLLPDRISGRGALGGVYTAIYHASHPLVAIVACDMPFASVNLFAAERDILLSREVDVVIPHLDDGLEPFHAVYRRETCLPKIEEAIEAGKWRVDSWFAQVKVHLLNAEEVRQYDPDLLCFRNVNTREEFRQAEALSRQIER